jgi:GntR family transcriptional regulator, vanillate catabolism transcriptional regulator
MAEPQVKTQTRRAQIELREQILSGELPAGTRLYEMAIASALDVSRTPAREAMSRLVEEGLLERHRSGGFRVRSFSLDDVRDAIELRGALEGIAARLAAERRPTDEDLQAIRETVARLDACFGDRIDDVDFEVYAEANASFHAQLAQLSGSTIIQHELDRVTSLPFASPSAFVGGSSDTPQFLRSLFTAQEQHREIVAAIAEGEGMRAEMLAREHARSARRNLEHAIGDHAMRQTLPGMALIVS